MVEHAVEAGATPPLAAAPWAVYAAFAVSAGSALGAALCTITAPALAASSD